MVQYHLKVKKLTDYKSAKENNEKSGELSKVKDSSNKNEDQVKANKSSNNNNNNKSPKADASAKKDTNQSKANNSTSKKQQNPFKIIVKTFLHGKVFSMRTSK